MKPSPKQKVRKIKAWAIISEQGHLAYENDCPLIYRKKIDAKLYLRLTDDIVPCVISYLQ